MKFKDLLATCGKRVRRIQAHRNQQRPNFAPEILPHPAPLRSCAPPVRNDTNAMRIQRWHQIIVVERILARHQVMRLGRQGLKRGLGTRAFGFPPRAAAR